MAEKKIQFDPDLFGLGPIWLADGLLTNKRCGSIEKNHVVKADPDTSREPTRPETGIYTMSSMVEMVQVIFWVWAVPASAALGSHPG